MQSQEIETVQITTEEQQDFIEEYKNSSSPLSLPRQLFVDFIDFIFPKKPNHNFGLSCVMGNFWSGKTFWTFLDLQKLDKTQNYIIANVPYSFVDYYWSDTDDLLNVFKVLWQFSETTNHDVEIFHKDMSSQKNIVLVVDEAHLYLWSRESLTKWSILSNLKTILTQCRKRKIKILFITQRLTQIDIFVRRLSDYVIEYRRTSFLWLIQRVRKTIYENRWDVADIETDQSIKINNDWETVSFKEDSIIEKSFFSPLTTFLDLFIFLDNNYIKIIKEEFNTLHISWYKDSRVKQFTYEYFLDQVYPNTNKDYLKNQTPIFKKKPYKFIHN